MVPIPPEGTVISAVKTLLSEYLPHRAEVLRLEKALAAAGLDTASEVLLRRRLWHARLSCLQAERAISRLESPRLRLLLAARYLEGLSWREMTDRLSLSESSLYQLHRRALELLENATPGQSGRSEPGPY